MIEGSQIDWGGHDNSLNYILSEFKEFDLAIAKALEFAKADGNTLVIVTADHETGGMALSGGNVNRSRVKADFTSGEHSGSMVPVFSYGPYSELFKGIYENTAIFDKMLSAVIGKD
jgi:alkaline phosphatase